MGLRSDCPPEAPDPGHTLGTVPACIVQVAAAQPVLFDAELTPGDVLYLPRGFVHSAAAQHGVSLHLTLGVLATTVHDVLRQLVDMAGEDVAFRRSLTPRWPYDDDLGATEVKTTVADLVDWLGRVDTAAVAERMRDRFVANRTPLLDGQLLEIARLDDIDDGTIVARRSGTVGALAVGFDHRDGDRLVQ